MRWLLDILTILCDGEFHSGDDIGNALGISRAAVWKRVQKLIDQGISVQSIKGKGYRLQRPLELLDKQRIITALNNYPIPCDLGNITLTIEEAVTSTNDVAARYVPRSSQELYFCLAEQQTNGRGRRGRSWISPFGQNIYLSSVWQCQKGVSALEGLSLAVGLSIVRAFGSFGLSGLGLKWPNDVQLDGKKIAGVLLEMAGDPSGTCQVVIGVGVNVALDEAAAEAIDQPWTDLASQSVSVTRNELAAALIAELVRMLEDFQRHGFNEMKAEWDRFDVLKDSPVWIKSGDNRMAGIARGVDRTGSLIFESDQGVQFVRAGEVTVRKHPDAASAY